MQIKKKKQPSSKLKSLYLSCRNNLPCSNSSSTSTKVVVSPIPISKNNVTLSSRYNKRSFANYPSSLRDDHRNELVEMQWKRVHELEKELVKVEEWLCTELAQLKRYLKSNNTDYESICVTKYEADQRDIKFGRLDGDGGYLYSLNDNKVINWACQDLVVQFSSPSIVPLDIGSNISEVLHQMSAMGKENLRTWLFESMPMTDISIKNTHKMNIKPCNTPNDLLEAILLDALQKLRNLVFEGLRIQKGVKEVVKQRQKFTRRRSKNGEEKIDDHAKGDTILIMAMLIQPRDPRKGYEAVNEMMIGFVEAAKNVEESGFVLKGVHVAGLVARKRNGQAIHNCLWYVSA